MLIHQIVEFCHETERLGISFKMKKIQLHLISEHVLDSVSAKSHFGEIPREPLPDRDLPEMPKRRIPDIMYQPGALEDV